jgi:predicted ester cyclase
VVTRFYEDGVNGRNWEVVTELLAPGFTHNGERLGPDGQRRNLETLYAAFPDVRVTLDDTVFAGDTVITRMTWSGIHRGAFMGIPACGRRVSWTAISIIRLSAGKFAQAWVIEDTLGLLQQIGGVVEARSR